MSTTEKVDFSTTSRQIRSCLKDADYGALAQILRSLNTTEIIEQLRPLGMADAAILYRLLSKRQALEIFQELDAPVQAGLIQGLQRNEVIAAFAAIDAADRVALLDELPAKVATGLLRGLDAPSRSETSLLLGYPEGSVGRVLDTRFATLYPEFTVQQARSRLRERLTRVGEPSLIMVIDRDRRLLGAVHLAQLLAADPEQGIASLLREVPSAQVQDQAVDAARLLANGRAELLPVLDSERLLVGVLAWRDALEILEAAEEERTARSAGAEPLHRPYLGTPIRTMVRARIVWLLVLAIGATLTVKVLSSFEQTLETMVVLSLFIPLIVGIGGNTGNQAATTVTRALAMGEVRVGDIGRVLLREVRIGAVLGVSLGAIGFLVSCLIFGAQVAVIIGLTLVALCTIAAGVGGIMPVIGKLLKVDPAVFSNPFISTFVDAAGLVVYLSVAVLVLG
ncbi:magnesium transporter [Glutamicibacter sp.]|uniref:magnesium transporter n=1 Tax=Glutamicibacter sp. TaxID=1931995 RepID=UPI0028BE5591|nr:magnesium transporter [Glutamicibacter sp.]